MTPSTVIGMDPGVTGAVFCLHADTGDIVWWEDMPLDEGKADVLALVDLLAPEHARMVAVERPYFPAGRKDASAQWWNYHACVAAVQLARLPLTTVTASVWVKADPSLYVAPDDYTTKAKHARAVKARRRERAAELYPTHADLFARAKDDGRADAALIARWAWANPS
jgi:crossover junction endodeoxyribonuclease RuvC